MTNSNRYRTIATTLMAMFILTLGTTAQAVTITVYEEDFDSFTNGSINGQNGWSTQIGDGLDIGGGADKVVAGDGTDGASNVSVMQLSQSTQSITVEWAMRSRASSGFQNGLGLQNGAGTGIVSVFANSAGFRLRRQDGSYFFTGSAVGTDDDLSGSMHQWFDHRLSFDFTSQTGLWEVSRQTGDGLYSTITAFSGSDIGPLIGDASNWRGLFLRANSASEQTDDINITAVVPEPASASLLALGIGGLMLRRRRK